MAKCVITAGWDHCPHISAQAIADMISSYPAYELEARRNGTPTLGAGKIYPLPEELFTCVDFAIPDHWPRAYGLDVGWDRTAAIFGAWNQDADVVYIYSEHYAGEAIPAVHAESIKARGEYIPGVIDPAARGRSQVDGAVVVEQYKAAGLDLEYAQNAVSGGIYQVWKRLVASQLKIFVSCGNLLAEMKLYRRDEKGKVVKVRDHACDALRYFIMSGLARAIAVPAPGQEMDTDFGAGGWMR